MNTGTRPGAATSASEEIDMFGLWRAIAEQKWWVLGTMAVGVVGALIMVSVVRPEWEASGLIQTGQVGKIGLGQDSTLVLLIEPPARAVERMKLATFEESVLARLKVRTSDDEPGADLYRKSLKVRLLPNTDLIELKVRAYSRDEAREWAEETVAQLRAAHQQVAEPSLAHLEALLVEVRKDIQRVQEERKKLLATAELRGHIGPGNRFAENVLFASIASQKDAELRNFESRRLALEEQLSPARSYPTGLLNPVYVPEKPVFPRKLLIVILTGGAGLVIGILAALLRHHSGATPK